MIDLDKKAGRIVSDGERGICVKQPTEALFLELLKTGLDHNEAFVESQKALKAARRRHSALPHALAHLSALAVTVDEAIASLLNRMADFEQQVAAARALTEIDMGVAPFEGCRELFNARILTGRGATMASWVPTYEELRDAR